MTHFMGVVIACLEAADFDPAGIRELANQLQQIAVQRPDLVERYNTALAARDSGNWSACGSSAN
jgi:hypothetical protein